MINIPLFSTGLTTWNTPGKTAATRFSANFYHILSDSTSANLVNTPSHLLCTIIHDENVKKLLRNPVVSLSLIPFVGDNERLRRSQDLTFRIANDHESSGNVADAESQKIYTLDQAFCSLHCKGPSPSPRHGYNWILLQSIRKLPPMKKNKTQGRKARTFVKDNHDPKYPCLTSPALRNYDETSTGLETEANRPTDSTQSKQTPKPTSLLFPLPSFRTQQKRWGLLSETCFQKELPFMTDTTDIWIYEKLTYKLRVFYGATVKLMQIIGCIHYTRAGLILRQSNDNPPNGAIALNVAFE